MLKKGFKIVRIEKPTYIVYTAKGYALLYEKKFKTLEGYPFMPSEILLKNMGVSLYSFLKAGNHFIYCKLRKEPSKRKLIECFNQLDKAIKNTYKAEVRHVRS